MTTNCLALFTALAWFAAVPLTEGEEPEPHADFPPRSFVPERYSAIWEKNPFVLEVALPDDEVEDVDEWSRGLVLLAVNRIDGEYVVHLENTSLAKEKDPHKARARYQRLVENANRPSRGGLVITHVKAHRDPHQVEVTVMKRDGERAKEAIVKYDRKTLIAKRRSRPKVTTPTARQTRPEPVGREARNGRERGGRDRGARGTARRGGKEEGGQRGRGGSGSEQRRVVLPPSINR